MKNKILLFSFALVFSSIGAQDPEIPEKEPKLGIGLALFNLDLLQYDELDALPNANTIYFPVNAGKKIRIELGIGFLANSYNGNLDVTGLNAETGFFYMKRKTALNMLAGIRLGVYYMSGDQYLFAAPALGGEYYFSPHFSLGIEAQLKAVNYTPQEYYFFTNTQFAARVYF